MVVFKPRSKQTAQEMLDRILSVKYLHPTWMIYKLDQVSEKCHETIVDESPDVQPTDHAHLFDRVGEIKTILTGIVLPVDHDDRRYKRAICDWLHIVNNKEVCEASVFKTMIYSKAIHELDEWCKVSADNGNLHEMIVQALDLTAMHNTVKSRLQLSGHIPFDVV